MRIAFASGKGGTGKTTLATNMFAVLAREIDHVIYVDADVEEPNGHIFLNPDKTDVIDVKVPVPVINHEKCTLCGDCVNYCQFNALAILGEKLLTFPALCHSCGACVELCPEKAISEKQRAIGKITKGSSCQAGYYSGCLNVGEALSPPLLRTLKSIISQRGTAIIDAPPGTSCPVVEAIQGSDFVVLVTEPTPFGMHDLQLAYNLTQDLNIPSGVVINRSDLGDELAREMIEKEGMTVMLEIPFRRRIAECYSDGKLNIESDPEFSNELVKLYDQICQVVGNG